MSGRVLAGVALVALVAVVLWRTLRSHEASSDAAVRPTPAADRTPPSSAAGSSTVPAPPALPPQVPGDPREISFRDEPRDAAWADVTEHALRERFRTVRGGQLTEAACRTQQCRLVIAGSRAQIARTIADLGGAHGLHSLAASIELEVPEPRPDGNLTLRAYAQFSR